jgi:hypothetical protein
LCNPPFLLKERTGATIESARTAAEQDPAKAKELTQAVIRNYDTNIASFREMRRKLQTPVERVIIHYSPFIIKCIYHGLFFDRQPFDA